MAKTTKQEIKAAEGISFFNPTPAKIELMASNGATLVIGGNETVTIEDSHLQFEAQRDPRLIKAW